jgi:hypothetical protein
MIHHKEDEEDEVTTEGTEGTEDFTAEAQRTQRLELLHRRGAGASRASQESIGVAACASPVKQFSLCVLRVLR